MLDNISNTWRHQVHELDLCTDRLESPTGMTRARRHMRATLHHTESAPSSAVHRRGMRSRSMTSGHDADGISRSLGRAVPLWTTEGADGTSSDRMLIPSTAGATDSLGHTFIYQSLEQQSGS